VAEYVFSSIKMGVVNCSRDRLITDMAIST